MGTATNQIRGRLLVLRYSESAAQNEETVIAVQGRAAPGIKGEQGESTKYFSAQVLGQRILIFQVHRYNKVLLWHTGISCHS